MNKIIAVIIAALEAIAFASSPTVTDVTAKQRYPWNGLVDITCKVSGINGTTNGLKFAVSAVIPNSGEVRKVSQLWLMQGGTKLNDRKVHTNGVYRLLWDAQADLGQVLYSNMVMRVTVVELRPKVQLWEGGPYWAETNIGAEEPWEYGYYFWWGDTVGYKREGDAWVATDGSSSSYSFGSGNTPTYNKDIATLQSEGWITADSVLVPEHDAAHVHWSGNWRMPTKQEQSDLVSKCDWTWTTQNGVQGHVVKGRGAYASNSIFLPSAGEGDGNSLDDAGWYGRYWSSVPDSSRWTSWYLSGYHSAGGGMGTNLRCDGRSVRPVQGFTVTTYIVTLDMQKGNGGTSSVTATYGSAMPSITVPTRSGYTFGGYYTGTNGSGTQYYTASGASARNWDKTSATTLYAKWTANTYSVTLDKLGGSGGTSSVTATYGSAMPSITVPTRSGYVFYGYYTGTNGSGTQYYTASGAGARNWDKTSATTLYAKWIANRYSVTLDKLGGSGGTSSVTATYGSAMPSITVPTRSGYVFCGYYTGTNGSGTQYYTASGASARNWDKTSATTLYAKWTDVHAKVQLWEGGPYWATTNIGAENPEDYGYYFWWGDTVGYKREGDAWVATDGSSSSYSFSSDNTPTYKKDIATLQSEGWITADSVLVPEHDAAHVHWSGNWRMPTKQEQSDLVSKCDWTWTTQNGVQGYIVKGKGAYASASIFLPCAGYGSGTSLFNAGSYGYYWSSTPSSGSYNYAWYLDFGSGYHGTYGYSRIGGRSVRPVQGFTE